MKSSTLKSLIKEAVKEAIQEELKDILLEAIKTPKVITQIQPLALGVRSIGNLLCIILAIIYSLTPLFDSYQPPPDGRVPFATSIPAWG